MTGIVYAERHPDDVALADALTRLLATQGVHLRAAAETWLRTRT